MLYPRLPFQSYSHTLVQNLSSCFTPNLLQRFPNWSLPVVSQCCHPSCSWQPAMFILKLHCAEFIPAQSFLPVAFHACKKFRHSSPVFKFSIIVPPCMHFIFTICPLQFFPLAWPLHCLIPSPGCFPMLNHPLHPGMGAPPTLLLLMILTHFIDHDLAGAFPDHTGTSCHMSACIY